MSMRDNELRNEIIVVTTDINRIDATLTIALATVVAVENAAIARVRASVRSARRWALANLAICVTSTVALIVLQLPVW